MDLEQHTRLQLAGAQIFVNADHRHLDQVGGSSLQRRVDRRAFGKAAHVGVLAIDVRDRPHPAKERAYPLLTPRLFERAINEPAYAQVLFEVSVNELFGFALLDAELLREPKRREAV